VLNRRRLLPVLACPLVLLAACGNSRTPVIDQVPPAAPKGFHEFKTVRGGVTFRIPNNWSVVSGTGPLIVTINSGQATVALWRYPRTQPLPVTVAMLAHARASLVAAARQRDRSLQVIRTRVGRVFGGSIVQLNAIEQVGTERRRVRSLHLFAGRFELVLEEYAPVANFHAVDHAVFSPLSHSLGLLPTAK
jgi:hypothetical protein